MDFKTSGIGKICLTICILLFLYVLLRAGMSSFTHDEGLSYKLVKDREYLAYTANNHLLNTWLMAFNAKVSGESELSLRFFSVLLFAVYLFYSSKLLLNANKMSYLLFGIPLLFLNPFVLDFFSLARGYGLSMGFVMASVYYFLRRTLKDQHNRSFIKDFGLSMAFACFALLSNLSLVNFYISLLGLFICDYVFVFRKTLNRTDLLKFILSFILACIPLVFSLKRLMVLKDANDLYVGADSFDDTIYTFIERSGYFVAYPGWLNEFLQTFFKWILPLGLVVTVFRKSYKSPLFRLGSLIFLMLIGFEAEHFLFATLFPIGRTGVYFIPLFGLFVFYLFVQFVENRKNLVGKAFVFAGIILVSLPLTFHFFYTMNLSHTFEWRYDKHTKEAVMALKNEKHAVKLGHNWIFGPAIQYYIRSRNLNIEPVKLEGNAYEQDFIYEFGEQVKDSNLVVIKTFNDTKSVLYKRAVPLK